MHSKFTISREDMFVIPSILITTPIFDDNDCELPSITVTRDSADVLDTEDFLHSIDDTEVHHNSPVTTADDVSIFPESLFNAARYV